ncbi:MAG TPA: S8 family serine peptidase [Chiayiivirga sp.]|nr:S8 family serine peptidase [Chiayiivirga sp.]
MNASVPFSRPLNRLALCLALSASLGLSAQAAELILPTAAASNVRIARDVGAPGERFDSFIVYYRGDAAPGEEHAKAAIAVRETLAKDLERVNRHLKVKARQDRRLATGGHLIRVPHSMAKNAANAFMEALASNPQIESIEPNARYHALAVPNDPHYSKQWGLHEAAGGLNIESAWDYSLGTGVVIAVIDTGQTNHPDLNAKTVAGYDFVSDVDRAGDGNGRDADPSDPGDWNSAGECGDDSDASSSSWHGTHVAGIAAALTHNGVGVAGAAPGAYLQPVRVLGKCGGSTADIAEAIIWASGGTVAGVPNNPTPARVLNMSLGGAGDCSVTEQRAIDSARSRKSVVVVAAGNSAQPVEWHSPANCQRVIAIAANDRDGERASYSNYGLGITVAAPGGDDSGADLIYSTINGGSQGPASATYGYMAGTSMATPYVSGVVALMLERKPSLTPDQVATILRNTARPFPEDCIGGCGPGIVDADKAVYIARGGQYSNFPVSAALYGDGEGWVVSTPAGITCGDDCSAAFNKGSTVTLKASPKPGYEFSGWYGACTGTHSTCTLNSLAEAKVTFASFNIPVGPLWNGSVRNNISRSDDPPAIYMLKVPAGATDLSIKISGGTGDADLYVRRNAKPTEDDYLCRPFKYGNNESCAWSAPVAGEYYVMIHRGDDYAGVKLEVRYTSPPAVGGTRLLQNVATHNISVPEGGARYYRVVVPADAVDLKIEASGGTGDMDMYVRYGEVASTDAYDCRPYREGNNETCSFMLPAAGTYYVTLSGYSAASGISLKASYSTGKRLTTQWAGAGGGTVEIKRYTTDEAMTTCAALPCTIPVKPGVMYTLKATASPGSQFPGWQAGQCEKVLADGRCRVVLGQAKTVTTRFNLQNAAAPILTINRSGNGAGWVGVNRFANGSWVGVCEAYPCRVGAPAAGVYDFVAVPFTGSTFNGWQTNQCDSVLATGECRKRVSGPTTVTVKLNAQ